MFAQFLAKYPSSRYVGPTKQDKGKHKHKLKHVLFRLTWFFSLGDPGNESMIIMKFVDIDSGTFI